jgi:hypothetical protein
VVEEPDNLVLKMLREMRTSIEEVRAKVFEHDERFAELKKLIEDRQETTSTGAGFAMHANLRTQAIGKEPAELKRRIDRLERSH